MVKVPFKTVEFTKAEEASIAKFLKALKFDLTKIEDWNLSYLYRELRPWEVEGFISLGDDKTQSILLHLKQKAIADYDKKARANPPKEIWVMAFHTHNMVGSISHVTSGENFWFTSEECQHEIDTMKSWIGMGDRSQYRPIKLVPGRKIPD